VNYSAGYATGTSHVGNQKSNSALGQALRQLRVESAAELLFVPPPAHSLGLARRSLHEANYRATGQFEKGTPALIGLRVAMPQDRALS